jgi:UTP--glucose-1-phosphate uridylyltransferase
VTSVRLDPEKEVSVTGVVKGAARDPNLRADEPGQTYDILALKEKPTPDEARAALTTPGVPPGFYLCHFGLHLFAPAIFECLGELIATNTRVKNEIQLTSAQELLRQRSPYLAAYLNGTRWDTGVPNGYAETQMALSLAGPYADDLRRRFDLGAP